MVFSPDVLKIDPEKELQNQSDFIIEQVRKVYRRKGIVVGLSGGIDSACMASIAVHVLGKDHVIGLIMPEKESNPVSSQFAAKHAEQLGIEYREIDISPTVDSVVPYSARDELVKSIIPEYESGYKYNITLPTDLLERSALSFYELQVQLPSSEIVKKRLDYNAFRAITAFANIKIRSRMLHLYAEADKRSLVVAGTTNRTEFVLGDFCKYGDGGTDIEPLSHLYKDQVYQISEYLEVIPEIVQREPSPDTFSLPVTDQEFFFRIPFNKLDLLLFAWEHEVPVDETALIMTLPPESVERAFKDFASKNRATAHLRTTPGVFEQ